MVLRRQLKEYRLADRIIVPSSFVWRTFVENGIGAEKMMLIPEGVDCDGLSPKSKRDDIFRILYIGHLSDRKGVYYLLEATAEMRGSGWELVLRGEAEPGFSRALDRYEGHYRRAGRVAWEGMADFISQASVVVVPSVEDGWCAVTVEAMACGVPVIVSANTGSADTVRDGEDGFVVPASNARALLEKILWLRKHPIERAQMGRSARARAGDFQWSFYRSRMGAFLSGLIADRE
jgi:glycosyltransferase involved in cell wall biosynthesis